jgi:hypothetical protein
MNALPPPERHALGEAPLVDLVDFKWLMIAEGLAVNLDRLRDDAAYARRVFQAADDSGNPTLRRISTELQRRLDADAA